MADTATSGNGAPGARSSDYSGRLLKLAGGYWASSEKWHARWLVGALVVLTICQVAIPVSINLWSQRLFDALEEHAFDRLSYLVGALVLIIFSNMVVTTTHLRFRRRLQVNWRRWLTRRVLDEWMRSGRHYLVNFLPGEHDNPDGRIAEDVRIATEYAVDLAHSLFYCLLLLFSFTRILWSLSGPGTVTWGDLDIEIPGHLVWVALAYAAVGTTVAVLLGRPLVRAVNTRQTREADFRFGLARVRENSEAIALIKGESDERRRFVDLFLALKAAWDRQTSALVHIFLFTSSYSVLSTAFPVLVAAPRYMAGAITLGVLMQTVQAFQQMEAALSWPIDNLAKGAEWRASVERILGLHESLGQLHEDIVQADGSRISIASGNRPVLAFHDVSVANPDGRLVISNFSSEVALGEHVLIAGDPSSAVKLFKTVAGLWPWGQGRIELPEEGSIFFMPQQPYLPVGTLRSALAYPMGPDVFPQEEIVAALGCVGLSHRAVRLDEKAEWNRVLSLEERQRMAFVRLLLHRPNWIFIQEATDALDSEIEEQMMQLLDEAFAEATVLTVGRHASLEAHHRRKLVLEKSADGLVLIRDRRKKSRPPRPVGRQLYERLLTVLRFGRPRIADGAECFIGEGEAGCDDETTPPRPPANLPPSN